MEWIDNHSWDPTLLCDKDRATKQEEPVEPTQRATVHVEHEPGTLNWLYQDYGGEG